MILPYKIILCLLLLTQGNFFWFVCFYLFSKSPSLSVVAYTSRYLLHSSPIGSANSDSYTAYKWNFPFSSEKKLYMPNITEMEVYKEMVSLWVCWLCIDMSSIFLWVMPESCWYIRHGKIFGISKLLKDFFSGR